MRAYEYRHRIAFEDTNLVGNVYYANHVRWQGRCREMFLREHAPEVLEELGRGLALVTTRVSCSYYRELGVFDEVLLRMTAGAAGGGRLTMHFDYVRRTADGREELVARGEQEIACLRRDGERQVAAGLPPALVAALAPFRAPDPHARWPAHFASREKQPADRAGTVSAMADRTFDPPEEEAHS